MSEIGLDRDQAQGLPTSEPALGARGLGKLYGKRQALHDVSFDAHAGELVAVIGPNGAGKTTLLSILAGVQKPSSGTVIHGKGRIGRGVGSEVGGSEVGWGVGWVPQTEALYSKLTVAENLRLFARLERVEDPEAAVSRMLEQTGLAARADERVARLSGGNRQRVNVALGLLADPPVVLLDEPTSALDPSQRERLWGFIVGLAGRGTSVVFSTHVVGEAARYAQRVMVLDRGRLIFDGTPSALCVEGGEEDFERAFVAFLRKRVGR